jgi:hypothetical protein
MSNEVQAKEILNVLPRYELVDITCVSTDGNNTTADVVYTVDGGELQTDRAEYERGFGLLGLRGDRFPFNTSESFVLEIEADCKEAADYQRDLLRAKN